MSSALMKLLGEVGGLKWYWAEPGSFLVPGVYYWDGKENVHVSGNTRAPIAEGGGDGEYSQGVMGDGAAEKHEGATRRRNSHFKGDGLMPAYHETHDAPHCPTCDCGVESLSRQGATRASESGDSETCEGGDPECGPVEFHDVEGVPLCRGCWESLLIDMDTIAAAPASGGGRE